MAPHYWLILGIVLLICELFTLDFALTCFAIACMAAALGSWAGLNLYWQLAIVAISILLLLFSLRPIMLKYLNKKGAGFKSNMEAIVGKYIIVSQITSENGIKYFAKNDGDIWELSSNKELKLGDKVKVIKVEGIILFVVKEEE